MQSSRQASERNLKDQLIHQKAAEIVGCVDALIDAYLQLHPEMLKHPDKESSNLSKLIILSMQAHGELSAHGEHRSAWESCSNITKMIERALKATIDTFAQRHPKKVGKDLNAAFAKYLNEHQSGHHRARMLSILLASLYKIIDDQHLPEPPRGTNNLRISGLENVTAGKHEAYDKYIGKLERVQTLIEAHEGAMQSAREKWSSTYNHSEPDTNRDFAAEQLEQLLHDILKQLTRAEENYNTLHQTANTKHAKDINSLVGIVDREVSRNIATVASGEITERCQAAQIKYNIVLQNLEDALLKEIDAKTKPAKKSPLGHMFKKPLTTDEMIKRINSNPMKSHYVRMLSLILNNIYQQQRTAPNVAHRPPNKMLEEFTARIYNPAQKDPHSVLGFQYGKLNPPQAEAPAPSLQSGKPANNK